MKLSELKQHLSTLSEIHFYMDDGTSIPEHFHVTEVGVLTRDFIDCGGTVRSEKTINMQLWEANDYDHRLSPQKLLHIIESSQKTFAMEDWEVEVEYQQTTIGKFKLEFKESHFILTPTATACLAPNSCTPPLIGKEKPKIKLGDSFSQKFTCSPDSGCC
jgi:hypothetical protein